MLTLVTGGGVRDGDTSVSVSGASPRPFSSSSLSAACGTGVSPLSRLWGSNVS
jgi:hypothetical protein